MNVRLMILKIGRKMILMSFRFDFFDYQGFEKDVSNHFYFVSFSHNFLHMNIA